MSRDVADNTTIRYRVASRRGRIGPLKGTEWVRQARGGKPIGHLIDSATNNHQRFIRAQGVPVLRLPGYAQDDWVLVQHYGERSWTDLVDFWCSYNRHLSHVIARIPESHRGVPCEIGEGSAVTLSYVALDYVGHVELHLSQIFA